MCVCVCVCVCVCARACVRVCVCACPFGENESSVSLILSKLINTLKASIVMKIRPKIGIKFNNFPGMTNSDEVLNYLKWHTCLFRWFIW